MKRIIFIIGALLTLAVAAPAVGQDGDAEQLKIAALEALIAAPPDRALPLAEKALSGDNSVEVKRRALFVLSHMDLPEARRILLDTAMNGDVELKPEAIRAIGIGGNPDSLRQLGTLYEDGDEYVREAVLEAYLIAGDHEAVMNIALNADSDDAFEQAVEALAAMGARDELRALREQRGMSESLIEAYAISGDASALREIALDGSDPELQQQAIQALGIVGGGDVDALLVEIYRDSTTDDIREAALEGLLISGHDQGVLELYRASDDDAEKRQLLEVLVMMDSDEVWDLIDSALDGTL
jgi:HEAT repeat protein